MLDLLHDVRLIKDSAIRDCRHHANDLKWRHAYFLTHRNRTDRALGPSGWRPCETALFTGKVDVRGFSKSHSIDMLREAFVTKTQAQLDRANIRGVLHDLLDGQQSERFPVMDLAAEHVDQSHLAVDDVRWLGQSFFKRRRRGDNFKRRSRL